MRQGFLYTPRFGIFKPELTAFVVSMVNKRASMLGPPSPAEAEREPLSPTAVLDMSLISHGLSTIDEQHIQHLKILAYHHKGLLGYISDLTDALDFAGRRFPNLKPLDIFNYWEAPSE